MILTRRRAMEAGGGFLAALLVRPSLATAKEIVEITMQGTANGSHVWFDPMGLRVRPGQTIRWTNRDPGNSHTVTTYDPSIFERPRRIPDGAEPWDSDYLLPGESFSVTLTVEGVYDYYCVPHEHAGMVGRIVVGTPPAGEPVEVALDEALTALPEIALGSFPSVADILAKGMVHRG
ncbi:MAG: plastocyanin/azurin family copper-binding protein [Devosia sp.]